MTAPGRMLSTYVTDIHHVTFPQKGPPPGIQHPTWHFWLACNSVCGQGWPRAHKNGHAPANLGLKMCLTMHSQNF